MPSPLFLLAISACLIHDIQTAPKSIALGIKEDLSSGSSSPGDDLNWLVTPCDQCQNLALTVRMAPNSLSFVEKTCRTERSYEQFCSQIRGKEAEFVNTVLESKKGNKEDLSTFQVCTNYSACDPSQEGKEWWKPKSYGACEQCQSSINGLTHKLPDELPYGRLEYYTMEADLMKIGCRDVDFRQFSSEFCTLFEGREFEFVKSVMDCTGVKFTDDKVQPNCTVTGQIVDPESPNQECSSIKRKWDDPAYYSFADMLPYLGATVRIEVTVITVAEDSTYNPEHIEQMESIVYLWRECDVNIWNKPFRRIAGQNFQPIFNSPTILQCRYLTMNNAHFSFKDYSVLYTVKAIRIFHCAVDDIDLWQQFLEQPKIKPVVVFCFLDREVIEILLDRLSKAFSSATSPNAFKIAFVQNRGPMAEFRETNKTSGEILELKKGISVELLTEPLKNFYTCTLERFSI
ncbi:hypothetical protein Ddc_17011 [Ditylenchus destructor]|nr:hypothetical protein Ddc_17011 [Ditylenchus destructor]